MPNPRVATCLFCDDVRAEVGNKISLMGLFTNDIIFTLPPPVTYPKLGLVIWVFSDIDDIPDKFTVRILMPPDRTEIAKFDGDGHSLFDPSDIDEFSAKATIRIIVSMGNVIFSGEGMMEIMVETEGHDPIRAGRLR